MQAFFTFSLKKCIFSIEVQSVKDLFASLLSPEAGLYIKIIYLVLCLYPTCIAFVL